MSGDVLDGSDHDVEMMKLKALREIQRQARAKQSREEALKELGGKAITLTDFDFYHTVAKYPLILADYWAPWCGPCRMVSPAVDQLAEQYSGRVAFGRVNVDENQRTAAHFGVQGIPTLMLFKDGNAVDQLVGAYPKGVIDSRIRMHLGTESGGSGGGYR